MKILNDKPKNSYSIGDLLLGILPHLSRRRRWQLGGLLLVMLASGVAEIFSLAAVLPFLAVLTNPQRLWDVPSVQALANAVRIREATGLLLPATSLLSWRCAWLP